MSNTKAPVGPSDQASILENDKESTELRGSFSSRRELQSLVATKLRNRNSFAPKTAMMQNIGDTLPDAIKTGFLSGDADFEHAFFLFIEMALTDMVHYVLMNKLTNNSFELSNQSEVLTNKLAEEECEHTNLLKRVLKITSSINIRETLV